MPSRRRLAEVVLPWCAGVLCFHQLPRVPEASWWVAAVLLALWAAGSRSYTRWLVWGLAGFCWTALHVQARLDDRLSEALVGQDLAVSGWVDGFPRVAPRQVSFSLRTQGDHVPSRLRLTWYEPDAIVEPGDAFEFIVRLREPRGLANSGGFDYERWLFTEGYGATGYVVRGELDEEARAGLARRWLGFRAGLARQIGAAAPGTDSAALLTALAIGERFRFTDAHWSGLRRTGTSHLVAISGLHVGLVAGLVFFSIRRLWLRLPAHLAHYDLEAAALASLVCAAGYAALAGFSLPTQRAVLMLAVAMGALASRRSLDPVNGLTAAAFVVLLWDPLAPLSISFWLSFLAVALLWQLGQRRLVYVSRSRLRSVSERLGGWVRVQCGISFGLVPVLALFFGELSLVSPLVNFVAIPFFSLVLVPLTLVGCLSLPLPFVGHWATFAAGVLAEGVWVVLERMGQQAWAVMTLAGAGPWLLVLAAAGALTALPAHALPGRRVAWIALLPLVFARAEVPEPGELKATVLDVGHGLAILLQTHSHTLLYDAGPRYPSGFDTGAEVVLPAMLASGWEGLDAFVISHGDKLRRDVLIRPDTD